MTKYTDYTKEQLIEEIKQIKRRKKFGLVWEDKPEDVVTECKTKFPVLREDHERAILDDNSPSSPTHLIIEGDNYHSLSVLNVTHKGKIDVIYIDPPYNTGSKDFKYNDSYVDKEDGFRHSKWLSFMEKRLRLARELLSEKGVIFISIDDNEQANLKVLCDKVFGEKNFITCMIRQGKAGAGHDSKEFAIEYDYVLAYSKNRDTVNINKEKVDTENDKKYKFTDDYIKERGKYYLRDLDYKGSYSQSLDYPITLDTGKQIYAGGKHGSPNTWRWSESKFEWGKNNGFIVFKGEKVYIKQYQFVDNEGKKRERFLPFRALVKFLNSEGSTELARLDLISRFPYPKPISLINYVLRSSTNKNSIILDFFAGSGTTGQAVLELNKDGGNRQFILCTNNENNICEDVTYPRIKTVVTGKRADGTTYSDGIPANVRYFKTDFVERSEDTDENRVRLTERCHELLQVKEGCYKSVETHDCTTNVTRNMRVWRNASKLLVVIFDRYDDVADEEYITEINTLRARTRTKETVIYRFSISGNLDMDVRAIPNARLEEIPEEILKVYKQIFKTRRRNK